MSQLGRPPEPKQSGFSIAQVSSVVQVESPECPKIEALRARLKHKSGDTFFDGRPVFPPPVRGPYSEAKIRLNRELVSMGTGSSPSGER